MGQSPPYSPTGTTTTPASWMRDYTYNRQEGDWFYERKLVIILPTGSEERGVLGVGSIPVAILLSYQDMKTMAL